MRALTLHVEQRDGEFTGMSHDGAIVVVRNSGSTTCTLPASTKLAMTGARGLIVARGGSDAEAIVQARDSTLPLELDAGRTAAARLRWITGNVFGDASARSVVPKLIALDVGGGTVKAPIRATVWGRGSSAVTFEDDRFETTLTPLGPPSNVVAGTFVGEGPARSTLLNAHGQPSQRLTVVRRARDTFRFSFDGRGEFAPNAGSIAGSLAIRGPRAMYVDATSDCKIAIDFHDPDLSVAQTGSCGFGAGVTATGRYRER